MAGNRKQRSKHGGDTRHAAALSTLTGHGTCPDRATEHEEEKEEVCVRLCAAMRVSLCGLVSGDGRVVRYEVSAAQFGCGSEHNESD